MPAPGVAVLRAGSAEICLLEKPAGSRPSVNTEETRHHARHWTPVHMDFYVDDLQAALERVLEAGALNLDPAVAGNHLRQSLDPSGKSEESRITKKVTLVSYNSPYE
ncbi:MAG: hypothetical protein HQL86_01830, partial [Magnetococcales bacterium]|nr:hypothetical protein [Magnetococcales bacterium]